MAEFKIPGPGNNDANKPIPFDEGKVSISHSPLNLGGGDAPPAEAEERPVPVVKDTGKKVSWPDRITGVKTFYTKLHSGAIEFLDEAVATWLRDVALHQNAHADLLIVHFYRFPLDK